MTSNTKKSTKTATPPIAKLRIGLINATIWDRTTESGTFYSVNFERRYRDSHNEWRSSDSFNAEDLLTLAKLADQAHTKVLELRAVETD